MSDAAYDLPEKMAMQLVPVGVMRSPYRAHWEAPRQPAAAEDADAEVEGRIVLKPGLQNLLRDLTGFSHAWILFWFNYSNGWNHTVKPPRDTEFRGLYATRSPHRPNPIGLSLVEVKSVSGCTLTIGAHDILDGSPILDIKPYVPYADVAPNARAGWVGELDGDASS